MRRKQTVERSYRGDHGELWYYQNIKLIQLLFSRIIHLFKSLPDSISPAIFGVPVILPSNYLGFRPCPDWRAVL